MSAKLIEERPLIVLPSLAREYGLLPAIILQQLHFLTELGKHETREHKGLTFVRVSIADMMTEIPTGENERTFRRAIKKLAAQGALRVEKLSAQSHDQAHWYSVTIPGRVVGSTRTSCPPLDVDKLSACSIVDNRDIYIPTEKQVAENTETKNEPPPQRPHPPSYEPPKPAEVEPDLVAIRKAVERAGSLLSATSSGLFVELVTKYNLDDVLLGIKDATPHGAAGTPRYVEKCILSARSGKARPIKTVDIVSAESQSFDNGADPW